jgi:hypothetical protein
VGGRGGVEAVVEVELVVVLEVIGRGSGKVGGRWRGKKYPFCWVTMVPRTPTKPVRSALVELSRVE